MISLLFRVPFAMHAAKLDLLQVQCPEEMGLIMLLTTYFLQSTNHSSCSSFLHIISRAIASRFLEPLIQWYSHILRLQMSCPIFVMLKFGRSLSARRCKSEWFKRSRLFFLLPLCLVVSMVDFMVFMVFIVPIILAINPPANYSAQKNVSNYTRIPFQNSIEASTSRSIYSRLQHAGYVPSVRHEVGSCEI